LASLGVSLYNPQLKNVGGRRESSRKEKRVCVSRREAKKRGISLVMSGRKWVLVSSQS